MISASAGGGNAFLKRRLISDRSSLDQIRVAAIIGSADPQNSFGGGYDPVRDPWSRTSRFLPLLFGIIQPIQGAVGDAHIQAPSCTLAAGAKPSISVPGKPGPFVQSPVSGS